MLDNIDKSFDLEKEEAKKRIKEMQEEIYSLQQTLKDAGIPVMIIIEGFGASGKGEAISDFISELDPRGFNVYVNPALAFKSEKKPFMWPFWKTIPEKGCISVLNHSYYNLAYRNTLENPDSEDRSYDINTFEKNLSNDGYLILKFFLHMSKKEQKRRFEKLLADPYSAWRISENDLKCNKEFDYRCSLIQNIIEKTNTENAPWHVIWNEKKREGSYKILSIILNSLKNALKDGAPNAEKAEKPSFCILKSTPLSKIDLDKIAEREFYKEELKKEKNRLKELHGFIYKQRIPVILAFEGWDAAGKGGAIRRLSWALDPRGFDVIPIAAPNKEELAKHYLWRFWKHVPKDGHIAIFDRTWYGRVMVERIEGFTPEKRCVQAFDEINEFEEELAEHGAIILKFFIHISKEEQLKRFEDRQNTPEKMYKITDEDWRNREKWDKYEKAIDEMIEKTSTESAPWIVVEGNDKKYARLKILKAVRQAIEERI